MSDLILIGDEAWSPAELEARERQTAKRSAYRERNREHLRAYHREWRKRNAEHLRAYNREWMRRKRASIGAIGYLHELSCDGQHWRARKRCKPIPMFRREDVAA